MLNKGSEKYQSARRTAVDVARAVVDKREGICAGSRLLSGLAHVLAPDSGIDPDFAVLLALDSETDRFPLGKVRDRWDPAALRALDVEREEIDRLSIDSVVEDDDVPRLGIDTFNQGGGADEEF